jgi:hypothetical protein
MLTIGADALVSILTDIAALKTETNAACNRLPNVSAAFFSSDLLEPRR